MSKATKNTRTTDWDSEEPSSLGSATTPIYWKIVEVLKQNINRGQLAEGMVLLEGPLAGIFNSSRTPVKQALSYLHDEGVLSRFNGRGFVVGSAGKPLLRVPLTSQILGLDENSSQLTKTRGWERIYESVERELIYRSVFGRFQVNELELGRYYNVGRTIAHEAMLRAHSTGLVTKDEFSRWYIVPLDEKRINDLYDLRELLEPALIQRAAAHIPAALLAGMRKRLESVTRSYPDVTPAQLDGLEIDLHVSCLEYGENNEIFGSLSRTRCILISGKHILGSQMAFPKKEPLLEQHLKVLKALRRRDGETAAAALLAHLKDARPKIITRLAAFREIYAVREISYIR